MKKLKKNWLRHVIQWGIIISLVIFLTKMFGSKNVDCEAYCPFGGVQTLATFLEKGSLACAMTATQIMMGVFLAVGIVLFGKLFCGYLCPLGWATEWIIRLRKKFKVKPIVIASRSTLDRLLRIVKYVLLFWIFYMTVESSELFCKNFDPYYATATGFKGEITLWMTIISITIFLIGNFLVDMFWCKYLCPLGALSNIFKFAITFIVLVGIYLLLGFTGLSVSWVWLLGATALLGWLWEIIYLESKVFPLLKVVRDEEKCTDCGICRVRCPYTINVDEVKSVKHIDCTLCGECVAACPDDALHFGGQKWLRWGPAILSVALFFIALFVGNRIELPTIDETWGTPEQHGNLERIRIDGLRSVYCFGSSKTFKARLEKIPGVYRVATFVKNSYANVYFNPEQVTEDKIREEIYIPTKYKIVTPPAEESEIKVITIYTEKMFDRMDPNYLGLGLRQTGRKYYGIETEYNCPLVVRLFMGMDEPIDEKFMKEIVEAKELAIPTHGGGERIVKTGYEYEGMAEGYETISRLDFIKRMFEARDIQFRSNQKDWDGEGEAIYNIVYPNLDKPIVSRNIPYLSNFLSQQEGLLSLVTLVDDEGQYCIQIKYDERVMDEDKIWELLNKETWSIKFKDGIRDVDAKLKFKERGEKL